MATFSRSTTIAILAAAGVTGLAAGLGSAGVSGWTLVGNAIGRTAVAVGAARQRPPQAGDRWDGCNDARAAGTAPIYRGEPGYRENMDGDGDGIACEPVPG